jgi:hypothetical protein
LSVTSVEVAFEVVAKKPSMPSIVTFERREVDEAKIPLRAQIGEVVAAATTPKFELKVNGSAPPAAVASVPQKRMPATSAFTSQAAWPASVASVVEPTLLT